ncbi:putative organic radical activating enzyme [Sphingobium sp. SYK-6]|uniref:7-carboxy-7-deazaguanine synthase n=1 Tax=Sphingobium sp. (strain NBRC 103272 / SYK-6) TaxID=627192 RepID=UPI0002277A01|nr:7-carboxy-7-deazaguanine synthase [Sphingobium sp. SYK-6]BAK68109.1 putative organic radical activating enzyme [Sphingobium sp. SYK-6]
MSYAVKEMFLTLQGEGMQAGRRAVFLRFAGCNLWSGREADRAEAVCRFCDTDFVGTDGENGGRFASADALADAAAALWGAEHGARFLVVTGGEPMLQLDASLVDALHARGFEIAVESNGTLPATPGIDWLCISPKGGSTVVQRTGDELKLVWPQEGIDPAALLDWDFGQHLVQPMDSGAEEINAANRAAAIALVMADSRWRLSLQTHKLLGLK